MLDWDDLRYFLAIAHGGTLARAATALGINATTVGRRLGARGARRRAAVRPHAGRLHADPAGRDLLPHAERMRGRSALARARGARPRPAAAGSVRVTATEMIATRFIMPHLPRLHARYPEITIELECSNRNVSLTRREADIALRLARPREENVVTRRLSDIPLALYASPGYLERRGRPEDPERSLRGHEVVLFAGDPRVPRRERWFEARLDGARIALRSDSVSSISTRRRWPASASRCCRARPPTATRASSGSRPRARPSRARSSGRPCTKTCSRARACARCWGSWPRSGSGA